MPRAQPSSNPLRRSLSRIVAKWQQLIEIVSNPYRPELYYMRGPGPKWHAKHQPVMRAALIASRSPRLPRTSAQDS